MRMAENIFQHGQFYCGDLTAVINPDDFTKRPPLYPIFAGIFSFLGTVFWLLYLVQSALVYMGIYIVRNAAIHFSYKSSFDKYVLAAIPFLPSFWIYPQLAMSESLFFFMASLLVYTFVKFLHSGKESWFGGTIGVVVLSAFGKPVMFPLALIFCVIGLFYGIIKKYRFTLSASLIGLLLFMSYFFFNYQRTGAITYSSISTINLVDYNSYYFNLERGGKAFAQAEKANIYAQIDATMPYSQQLALRNKGGQSIILSHPVEYGIFHIKGLHKFFLFPGRYDVFTFFGLDQERFMMDKVVEEGYVEAIKYLFQTTPLWLLGLIGGSFMVKIILAMGFIFFLFDRSISLKYRVLTVGVITYIAILTGPLGAARFFMPIGGIYLIISIMGIMALSKYGRQKAT